MLRSADDRPQPARSPGAPVSANAMASIAAPVLFSLIALHGLAACRGQCSNVTQLSLALDTLLASYDRERAPVTPLAVAAVLDVRHAAVDDRASTVRLLADLRLFWQDERVKWNVTEWGCDSALVAAEQLWLPDVTLLNAAASGDAGDASLRARLNASGAVEWVVRLDARAPLDMALERWPNDEQSVSFMFTSKSHTLEELDLTLKPLPLTAVYQTGAWELLSVARSTAVWQEAAGARRRVLTWQLLLRRRAAGAAHAACAVLCAAVFLLLTAGLLPPKHRAPIAVTAALTAAFALVTWTLRLPPSSSCPLVLRAAAAVCVCATVACVGAALVQRVSLRTAPPPRLLCTLLSRVSTLCRLTSHQESESVSGDGGAGSGAWRAAALLLDRALLTVLLLTLLVALACSLAILL
ncbi:neuronal acetylcholine receptor subunit alpha-10-like [Plodia interpunctella]|uniref:neuronal acetylcholine receptor subunit alpha-10-like n=1 Tax=Plodia interpunctella TaxID=58824 RepID=UPI002367D75D|nr:neuronal acetylcholine receptor subunit alpha-10-like [Plodia interpunctella]